MAETANFEFLEKLNGIHIERDLFSSTIVSDPSDFKDSFREIAKLDRDIVGMDYGYTIANASDLYASLQGMLKAEAVILDGFAGLTEEVEESQVKLVVENVLEKTHEYFESVLSYMRGRNRDEIKLRMIKCIEHSEFELAKSFVSTGSYFNVEEGRQLIDFITLLGTDTEAAKRSASTGVGGIFIGAEIKALEKAVSGLPVAERELTFEEKRMVEYYNKVVRGEDDANESGFKSKHHAKEFMVENSDKLKQGVDPIIKRSFNPMYYGADINRGSDPEYYTGYAVVPAFDLIAEIPLDRLCKNYAFDRIFEWDEYDPSERYTHVIIERPARFKGNDKELDWKSCVKGKVKFVGPPPVEGFVGRYNAAREDWREEGRFKIMFSPNQGLCVENEVEIRQALSEEIDPIFKKWNGKQKDAYLAYAIGNDEWLVVPEFKEGWYGTYFSVNERGIERIGDYEYDVLQFKKVFNIPGFKRGEKYEDFEVVKPAKFSSKDKESWELIERGEIKLGVPSPEFSFKIAEFSSEGSDDVVTAVDNNFLGNNEIFVGVYDNLLGDGVSLTASEELPELYKTRLMENGVDYYKNVRGASSEIFWKTYGEISKTLNGRTTAANVFIAGERVVYGNAGDTQILFVGKDGRASEPSKHTFDDKKERERAGNKVVESNGSWVIKELGAGKKGSSVSRSLGKETYDGAVSSFPDNKRYHLSVDDDCIIIASSGFWEGKDVDEMAEIARAEDDPDKVAQELAKTANGPFKVIVIKIIATEDVASGVVAPEEAAAETPAELEKPSPAAPASEGIELTKKRLREGLKVANAYNQRHDPDNPNSDEYQKFRWGEVRVKNRGNHPELPLILEKGNWLDHEEKYDISEIASDFPVIIPFNCYMTKETLKMLVLDKIFYLYDPEGHVGLDSYGYLPRDSDLNVTVTNDIFFVMVMPAFAKEEAGEYKVTEILNEIEQDVGKKGLLIVGTHGNRPKMLTEDKRNALIKHYYGIDVEPAAETEKPSPAAPASETLSPEVQNIIDEYNKIQKGEGDMREFKINHACMNIKPSKRVKERLEGGKTAEDFEPEDTVFVWEDNVGEFWAFRDSDWNSFAVPELRINIEEQDYNDLGFSLLFDLPEGASEPGQNAEVEKPAFIELRLDKYTLIKKGILKPLSGAAAAETEKPKAAATAAETPAEAEKPAAAPIDIEAELKKADGIDLPDIPPS